MKGFYLIQILETTEHRYTFCNLVKIYVPKIR